jgi:hypothetical protein
VIANGQHEDERMLQLLADRATEGLDRAEAAALEARLVMNPGVDADALDRTAAAILLTDVSLREGGLPPSLRGRLLADAKSFFACDNGT